MRLKPWTHWHSKAVLIVAIGLNVWTVLALENAVVPWVLIGVCIGVLLCDTVLWRFWVMNRRLTETIEAQKKLIQKLGIAKMDEVANQIARSISEMTGHEVEVVRVPNETLRKDKLH